MSQNVESNPIYILYYTNSRVLKYCIQNIVNFRYDEIDETHFIILIIMQIIWVNYNFMKTRKACKAITTKTEEYSRYYCDF